MSTASQEPTNETVKPELKKKKLIKRGANSNALKRKIWLAGHLLSLSCGVLTILWLLLRLPNKYYINSIIYRLCLVGACMSLTATFSHKFGLEFVPPLAALLAHQNFQYLVLCIVWMFTFKSVFKIVPYVVLSTLHLASFKNIQPVLDRSNTLATIISHDELILVVYLLLRTIFFRNASGFQLVVFLFFYWLRILYNKETTNLFVHLIDRFDGKISTIKNEKVTTVWKKVKNFLEEKQTSGMNY